MHTTPIGDYTFVHDVDFRGNVEIVTREGERLSIPATILLKFAAEVVRTHRMSKLERATAAQLLDLE